MVAHDKPNGRDQAARREAEARIEELKRVYENGWITRRELEALTARLRARAAGFRARRVA
jgi:hypothetical protein